MSTIDRSPDKLSSDPVDWQPSIDGVPPLTAPFQRIKALSFRRPPELRFSSPINTPHSSIDQLISTLVEDLRAQSADKLNHDIAQIILQYLPEIDSIEDSEVALEGFEMISEMARMIEHLNLVASYPEGG